MGEAMMEKTQIVRDSTLHRIRRELSRMSRTLQLVGNYVLEHPTKVINMSISQLAHITGAKSESAIVRFYKALGFSGYHDFKTILAGEIAGKSFYQVYEDILLDDDIPTVKQKMFQNTMRILDENLTALNEEALQSAVDLVISSKRIIFLGFGSAGIVAADGCFKFSELGLTCHYSADPHFNVVLLTEPQDGDVVFCVSYTGESRDVLIPAERAKPVAKVIALTGSADSPLGKIADVCITTIAEEKNYRTDVMISRLVQQSVINILYVLVGLRKGSQTMKRLSKIHRSVSYLRV
jgi:RpiR family transcriptional regulator, carbohydrate utilization regulator